MLPSAPSPKSKGHSLSRSSLTASQQRTTTATRIRLNIRIRNPSHTARGMGLLDQLWDETVAGPRPDHGLGKLRKYSSFSTSTSSPSLAAPAADVAPAVTRSISIARPQSLSVTHGGSCSVPSSPAGAPDSPFAAGAATTPRGDGWRAFRRKSKMAGVGEDAAIGPRSPTVYDWVVISSLDR